MIAVTYREKQLLLLLRQASPAHRRQLLKHAMCLASQRIRCAPAPENDNNINGQRDFLTE